jgi:spermidine synthase/Tfp pilus assembly protein PilF
VRLLANGGVPAGAAVGRVLAWNTLGALLGPLAAAFLLLPSLGLESTLKAAAAVHVLAAWVALRAGLHRARFVAGTVGLLAGALLLLPRWDLELLAAGAYRYPPRTGGVDLRDLLRAGELLYYRDGALATVSVKRLGSARALAVDGKVDATDTADMATQRLIAHLPLLLHGAAREALVVGLGSGATVASALKHPLDSLEVVEISPEVVEAARLHFVDVLQGALDDPRLRLRVTDARNHLLLTKRRFDLIVSEPSNPWMAGVASLFTREFFSLARARLRPQGVFGQWMHAYGMPLEDLRTVVGGFADVFPESALFQVSEGDLVLVGAAGHWPTPDAAELARRMSLPAVAEDLRGVGIADPATLAALFVLGPGRLGAFAAGAPRHTDERPILELHAARAMLARTGVENRRALLEAAEGTEPPEPWRSLRAQLGPEPLVARARMLERTTGLDLALEAYGRALRLDPRSAAAQEGLVRIAAASNALPVLETLLRQLTAGPDPLGARVSLARLYREQRRTEHAARELQAVLEADPTNLRALKLLAAIQGDLGKAGAAEVLAGRAQALAPGDAEAAALLASASLLAGDAKTASERAEAALGLDPTLAMALRVKALALARLSRHDEARAAFEALVRHDGGTWQSWAHYGAFLADVGDSSGAAGAFETAADLAPDRREAWEGLRRAAVALQDRRRLTRAERALFRLNAVPTGRP